MRVFQAFDRIINYNEVLLHVNSAGIFSEIDINTRTYRPNGWGDYQFIYIIKGYMEVERKGKKSLHGKGDLLLFKPKEEQIYGCKKDKNSAYIWIHFSGYGVKDVLKELDLYESNCYHFYAYDEDLLRIEKLISELSRKSPEYRLKVVSIFIDFLISLKRREPKTKHKLNDYDKISPAIDEIISHPESRLLATDYAKMCDLSLSRFLHLFKALLGKSPMQYKDDIKMNKAKNMLESTNLSVSEVSWQIGEPDPLYFSKKFKRKFGVSPSEFKNLY